jgi:hypothetical protein
MQHGEVSDGTNPLLRGVDQPHHNLLPMPESGLFDQIPRLALVHHQASRVSVVASRGPQREQVVSLEGEKLASQRPVCLN